MPSIEPPPPNVGDERAAGKTEAKPSGVAHILWLLKKAGEKLREIEKVDDSIRRMQERLGFGGGKKDCPKCDAARARGDDFCPGCGKRLI